MSALPVSPEVDRMVREGRARASELERAVRAFRTPGLTPQQRRLARVQLKRAIFMLRRWATFVGRRVPPLIDRLNDRELDFLSNALGRAARAFQRARVQPPESIRNVQRLIAPRLRLPLI